MDFKFDKIDKKLIAYIYHNFREPLSKIAKKCNLSRDQVEYRLKKYESSGLIKQYATLFNYSALGYSEFVISWVKLNNPQNELLKLRSKLSSYANIITYLDVLGSFDLVFDSIHTTKEDFQNFLSKIQQDLSFSIRKVSPYIVTSMSFFPLKEFGLNEHCIDFSLDASKQVKLSSSELKILRLLANNGRMRLIDMAKKTKMSSELIAYKLKQLYKNKIILGTRIVFDLEKMGFFFGNLRLNLNSLDVKLKSKLKQYCALHENINAVSFGLGEYNCLIQVMYKEEKVFRTAIRSILNEFSNQIKYSDVVLIENEGLVNTFPF